MSSKKCAREECGKTVYPLEELKCLDKVWHKQCFKCTVCGMTLNMKNYKGYDKMPYCEPHYPKTVASVVTDTPEMRRVAENTKNQSQVQYHAAYEKTKGTKIEIADDPEMERHRKNMHAQSQIAYSGELDKKKKMEEIRPAFAPAEAAVQQPQEQRVVGSIADYDPLNGSWGTAVQSRTSEKIIPEVRYCVDFTEGVSGRSVPSAVSPAKSQVKSGGGEFVVKAMYDYTAADKDEVSFLEGDIIVNCEKVDDGWMTGTVQRTLEWGMLPANYVQPHKLPTGLARIK
ncbi:unnamed protein product [Angiostrongylus costaricensis]|uniref:LIM and SH3 domain protein 1 n=1 Tax=Angiostrongylus costaricensis TaxID=334426 RepID=A0A0R3PNI9_ANGCS|nr:unnamed protein product [Angiostrongylus costaricensis]